MLVCIGNFFLFERVLFIYFCLCWVLLAVCGLPLVAGSRGYSLVAVCGLLIAMTSLVVEDGL